MCQLLLDSFWLGYGILISPPECHSAPTLSTIPTTQKLDINPEYILFNTYPCVSAHIHALFRLLSSTHPHVHSTHLPHLFHTRPDLLNSPKPHADTQYMITHHKLSLQCQFPSDRLSEILFFACFLGHTAEINTNFDLSWSNCICGCIKSQDTVFKQSLHKKTGEKMHGRPKYHAHCRTRRRRVVCAARQRQYTRVWEITRQNPRNYKHLSIHRARMQSLVTAIVVDDTEDGAESESEWRYRGKLPRDAGEELWRGRLGTPPK